MKVSFSEEAALLDAEWLIKLNAPTIQTMQFLHQDFRTGVVLCLYETFSLDSMKKSITSTKSKNTEETRNRTIEEIIQIKKDKKLKNCSKFRKLKLKLFLLFPKLRIRRKQNYFLSLVNNIKLRVNIVLQEKNVVAHLFLVNTQIKQ